MLADIQKPSIFDRFSKFMREAKAPVKCSMALMGLGQLMYKQVVKGIIYLSVLASIIVYFVLIGYKDLIGLVTLGTVIPDPWSDMPGDASLTMMLRGVLAVFLIIFLVVAYVSNVRDAAFTQSEIARGNRPKSFKKTVSSLLDEKFHVTSLFLPIVGVMIFNVLPIIFMIMLSFTNYGNRVDSEQILPPLLLSWTGFGNFIKIFAMGEVGNTFLRLLGWNIIWGVATTFLIYFGGIGLSLLLNKKCVKGKIFWRVFPILAYAIPGFIILTGFKFMFAAGGPINYYLENMGFSGIDFLGTKSKWWARGIGLFVVCWMSIPTQMLLMTGILSNMNTDLYEAAQIDGAGRWTQFIKLTLPFLIFSTTPMLITSFIGNFNNFGVFYFLRGSMSMSNYFYASNTDLLINWMYNLSVVHKQYALGAALSIILFIITSVFSLVVYMRSSAYKKEDTYR